MARQSDDAIDPEQALMLAYVPAAARAQLELLWRLDARLGSVVRSAREPGLAAIRLAWWREALERLDRAAPPAEPLLRVVAELLLPVGLAGAELGRLADGWSALLASPITDEDLAVHAVERGECLFTIAARLLGDGDPRLGAAGAGWALVDVTRRGLELDETAAFALAAGRLAPLIDARWPRPLRPLMALALLARGDALRRRADALGAPRRVARFAFAALLGR